MQIGTVSGLWFCRRSWRFKIHFWRNIVRFRKSYVCSNKLDVQETNCCYSPSRWTLDWDWMVYPALELWDLIVSVLGNVSRVSDRSGKPESDDHKTPQVSKQNRCDERHWCCSFKMSNPRVKKLFSLCLRTMKLSSRCSLKEEVLRWDTFPEPTELLFICCSIELLWTPKSKSNTSTPKNQLADILTKGNFTRDEWNHLLKLFNIGHFNSTACTATMAKRAQQESGEERVTAKSRLMMNLTARMPSGRVVFNFIKPGKRHGTKIKILKNLLEVTIDRGNLRNSSRSD